MEEITIKDIEALIPDNLRELFLISSIPLPKPHFDTVEALIESLKIISMKLKINKKYHLVIAKFPFRIPLSAGTLTYETKGSTINTLIENIMFFDFEKLYQYKHQIKIACILEEFVHALMNVQDELLTSHIVCLLYTDISCNDQGQYVIPE